MKKRLSEKFEEVFGKGGKYKVYFTPGRVNLIGEYTDFNGGHVFPCALTLGTYAVARKREDKRLRFFSMNFEELGMIEANLEHLIYEKKDAWTNYPKGVLWALQEKGYELSQGMDVLIYGDIPNGSGLSSSASLEVLTGFIIMDLFEIEISMTELALIGQYAENQFVGVNCGIMDQFACAMGRKNQAIFLDTADLSYLYAPLPLNDAKIVIMNTNKKRGLGDSKYNERRMECETALKQLQQVISIQSLGELTEEEFEVHRSSILDPTHVKRARHAVYENRRTIKAVEALKENNLGLFGELMIASHQSLQNEFEVTGIELDTIVESALKQEGVIGARMTGAGFGGCAVSIVKEDFVQKFIDAVGREYEDKIGYEADFYVVDIGDGPAII